MNLDAFKAQLLAKLDRPIEFRFPDSTRLAPHFHVTEVGKVTKDFVDCGGTRRTNTSCMLQTLVAEDTDHRLSAGKLLKILELTSVLGLPGELPVEAEVQQASVSIYSLEEAPAGEEDVSVDGGDSEESPLVFVLVPKNTACLAPDRCGIGALPVLGGDCSGETGCC